MIMISLLSFVLIALVLFQIKHFLCDFPLQNQYMLGKFSNNWFLPLSAHACVHGLFTFAIVIGLLSILTTLNFWPSVLIAASYGLWDFTIHFIIDRLKVLHGKHLSSKHQEPMKHSSFWSAIGLDQMGHHLTHYAIIFSIIFNIAI